MSAHPADIALALARGTPDRCGCGRPLLPVVDDRGARIGVTHTPEDDDWHCAFWGVVVEPMEYEEVKP